MSMDSQSPPAPAPAPRSLDDALALMRDLRARCEWDRAQTHQSLRPYLIEEAHEVDDAIAAQDYLGVDRTYYRPTDRGFEKELAERLERIRARLHGGE